MTKRTHQKMTRHPITVANHPVISKPAAPPFLPPSWTVLSEIGKVQPAALLPPPWVRALPGVWGFKKSLKAL